MSWLQTSLILRACRPSWSLLGAMGGGRVIPCVLIEYVICLVVWAANLLDVEELLGHRIITKGHEDVFSCGLVFDIGSLLALMIITESHERSRVVTCDLIEYVVCLVDRATNLLDIKGLLVHWIITKGHEYVFSYSLAGTGVWRLAAHSTGHDCRHPENDTLGQVIIELCKGKNQIHL